MNRLKILTALIILLTFSCTSKKADEADAGVNGKNASDTDIDTDSDGDSDTDECIPQNVTVGDASIFDPDYCEDSGHLVGVDGGFESARDCELGSECMWVAKSCYVLEPSVEDVRGINKRWLENYVGPLCGKDRYESTSESHYFAPYLIQFCRESLCEVIDIRNHELSECNDDSDCEPRVPDCCECGSNTDPHRLISLPKEEFTAYQDLICDQPPESCETCEVEYPEIDWDEVLPGTFVDTDCHQGHCRAGVVIVDPE